MQIQKYVPSKRTLVIKSIKAGIILLILTSLYANYWLLKAHYNFACEVNGQTVARFISKQTCGELEEYKMDSMELARKQTFEANLDLSN